MKLARVGVGCVCVWVAALAYSQAAPNVTVELREIDPSGAAELPPYTPVYGRVAYQTGENVRIALRPYRNGQPVERGASYSRSPAYQPPGGEAVAWFAFDAPQVIDDIRVIASNAVGTELASTTMRRSVVWSTRAAKPTVAGWVAPLLAQSDDLAKAQTPPVQGDVGATLITQLMFGCVPLSLILQVLALRRLTGGARKVAWCSAAAMLGLWLFVIVTAIWGSNLSPIWIVFLSPAFVLVLAGLFLATFVSRRRAAV